MTQQEILAAAESCGRQIDEIIVHCSATREGRDFSAADIRRWHVADRHFSDIGYHFVVRIDGSIEAGRPPRRPLPRPQPPLRRCLLHRRPRPQRPSSRHAHRGPARLPPRPAHHPAPRLPPCLHPRPPRLRTQSLPLLPRHLRIHLALTSCENRSKDSSVDGLQPGALGC